MLGIRPIAVVPEPNTSQPQQTSHPSPGLLLSDCITYDVALLLSDWLVPLQLSWRTVQVCGTKAESGLRFFSSSSGSEVDQHLAGCGLMLSALLQNTVQSSGGLHGLEVTSEGPYDFYQHPNMSEARLCLPVLEQLSQAVKQRLRDWPEHPALVQVRQSAVRLRLRSTKSPFFMFMQPFFRLL